jgi:hypothetical protein
MHNHVFEKLMLSVRTKFQFQADATFALLHLLLQVGCIITCCALHYSIYLCFTHFISLKLNLSRLISLSLYLFHLFLAYLAQDKQLSSDL